MSSDLQRACVRTSLHTVSMPSNRTKQARFLGTLPLELLTKWSGWLVSIQRPPGSKPGTLPTELHPETDVLLKTPKTSLQVVVTLNALVTFPNHRRVAGKWCCRPGLNRRPPHYRGALYHKSWDTRDCLSMTHLTAFLSYRSINML